MGSAIILPSTYATDGTSFYVRDASYMYTNVDSTTHAEISSYAYNTSAHYVFLRGFDFSNAVPSGMSVDSVTVRVNMQFGSGLNTGSACYPRLANGSTVFGNTATKSGNIYTITGIDWDTIVGYGSSFGIRVCHQKGSAYSSPALSVYGAEIDIEYSEPAGGDTVYVKKSGAWVEASKVYKKESGVWVEQTDLQNVFEDGVNYVSN